MKFNTLAWILSITTISSAIGETFRTDINPALQYYQAFLVTPDLPQADRDYLFNSEWRGQKLPDRFGELVARYDNEFRFVRHAAGASVVCDWGIDMSRGPFTLLPGLARNKGIAQAARMRAMWNLQQGRQVEAREDLLAAFTLARNSSRDGTLIAVLVQIALENIICSTVAENFGHFSPETLTVLADGMDAAPARATMADSIRQEKASFLDWLTARIVALQKENPGNDAKVMAALHDQFPELGGSDEGKPDQTAPNLWEQVTRAAGGTSEGILGLLGDEEPFFQRLAVVMALPHGEYEDQMQQLSAEIQSSPNPFVAQTFPAIGKARPKEFAVVVELAMVRAAVEYKLHGEAGLQSVTDPCGKGPFAFRRFIFEGVDRGFELRSAYEGRGFPEVLIFVEKDGPPFQVNFKNAGQAVPKSPGTK